MYIPKHFLESRFEVLHSFIRRHPLATICVSDGSALEADHVPLTLRSEPAPHGVLLEELTAEHERQQPHAWRVSDAPGDYIEALVRAVVGLRIEILDLVGKSKLSQNQPDANQRSLVEALRAKGDSSALQMADAIAQRTSGRP